MASAQSYIETAWCDIEGVYVKGWVHCSEVAVTSIYLKCGSFRAEVTDRHARPDVRAAFPSIPSDLCGFSGYLACPPFLPLMLGVVTAIETQELKVDGASVQAATRSPDWVDAPDPFNTFVAEMKAVRGRVVEVGARNVSPGAVSRATRFKPECGFTGIDIHAAEEVDLVADAHFLSTAVAVGSIDGVFSLAVMEHLAAPWLFAAEVNRVLRLGGLTYHVAPHSWPIHEEPNDFWRMSDSGLRQLFGAHMGFEILNAGMTTPVQMVRTARFVIRRFLSFPFHAVWRGLTSWHVRLHSFRKVRLRGPLRKTQ